MTDHVETSVDAGVLTIRLERPEKKNALTHAMYAAMADGLARANADPAVRVALVTGSGDSFTAGNDLGDFAGNPPRADGEAPVTRFLREISTSAKPVVAAVNGLAVGVGVTMLLHCDLVYAARSATFQAPFVNLALVPEAASSLLLPRLVGHAKASEMFLLGTRIDAAQAEAAGLVSAVFDDAALHVEAAKRAAQLAAKAPNAVLATKRLMRGDGAAIAARMAEEGALFARQLASPEVREAISAFMQKRPPDFSKIA